MFGHNNPIRRASSAMDLPDIVGMPLLSNNTIMPWICSLDFSFQLSQSHFFGEDVRLDVLKQGGSKN